jgi:type II secretory pathway component GspD/PulD (secretin)
MHQRTRLVIGAVALAIVGATAGLIAQDAVPVVATPVVATPVVAAPAVVPPPPDPVPPAAEAPAAPVAVPAVAAEAPPPAAAPVAEVPAVAAAPEAVVITGITPNPSSTTNSELISVTLDDVPLADVVKLFTKISRANIIAATTNLQGSVTANLQDVAWRPAFEAILERQNLLLVEKPADSGIFVIEARRAGEDPRVTDTVQLKFAKVDKLAALLQTMIGKEGTVTPFPEGNIILLQASQQKITEARKVIEVLDRPRSQVYIEARFVEMSAAASKQLGLKWDSLKDWGVTVKGMNGGIELNEGKMARYDTRTTKSVTDISRPFETTTTKGITDYAQKVVIYAPDPAKPGEFLKDPVTGLPLVTGVTYPYFLPDPQIVRSSSYPYQKEVPLYQIPTAINGAPGAGREADDMAWKMARGLSGQISASDFRLAMSAFEQIDGISIVSNPKIIVANEEEATVDMTTKEPYVKVTANRSTSGGGNTLDVTTELGTIPGKTDSFVGEAFFSYGVTLKVKPRVSAGIITVDISPSLSEWVRDYVIPGANADMPSTRYPIIRMKRINTQFSMQDGATAVIGGLTISGESNTDSGIPYLRKIPYIGPRLFGWKSRIKDQKELVIFVTVGIVDPEKPIDENIGMPKNAVLSRSFKEPGEGTKEELMLLKP